ncbi:hypothetical protein ALC62_03543 [Cyphomyrmex costatus]|uniref:Uncharacterized protein n=1 Tax=Cyphomyrmex costatus TaxID=456900 RepID=A0A151ILC1_9HYME|nr:hypothetical protein ALC62_03543 [Cyphomyrmex costatus]
MFKIGKCGEQGGNEGQDDRGVTKVCGVAKAARESFDISTRIPTRDVCVELGTKRTRKVAKIEKSLRNLENDSILKCYFRQTEP